MRILTLLAVASLGSDCGLFEGASAQPPNASATIVVQLRPLHTDSCSLNVMRALDGKVTAYSLDASRARVIIPIWSGETVNLLALVELLRAVGHEPLAMAVTTPPSSELTLRSAGFSGQASKAELTAALAKLDSLNARQLTFGDTFTATIPVKGERFELKKLLDVVGQAGYALRSVELRLSVTAPVAQPTKKSAVGPASTPAEPALPTQVELGSQCVILTGEPGQRTHSRMFRGLLVPLCCESCRDEWDKLYDEDKVRTLREAAGK